YLPQPHRPVPAGGGQALAVRAEGDAVDLARVALEGEDALTGPRVPDVDGVPIPGGGQAPAVGAEGDARVPPEPVEVTVTEPPEVVPLEAAQVFLARWRPLGVQQLQHAGGLTGVPGLLRQVHFVYVPLPPPDRGRLGHYRGGGLEPLQVGCQV